MSRVIWFPNAQADLRDIHDHIARDSKQHAKRWTKRVRDATNSLRRFPEAAGLVPEFESRGWRQTFVGDYRVIFRVRNASVEILAVFHGARRPPHHLDSLDSQLDFGI